jgi:hypothetical protein
MLTYKHISLEHKEAIDGFNCSDEISVELFLKEQAKITFASISGHPAIF